MDSGVADLGMGICEAHFHQLHNFSHLLYFCVLGKLGQVHEYGIFPPPISIFIQIGGHILDYLDHLAIPQDAPDTIG